jgi:hypothetical protein
MERASAFYTEFWVQNCETFRLLCVLGRVRQRDEPLLRTVVEIPLAPRRDWPSRPVSTC